MVITRHVQDRIKREWELHTSSYFAVFQPYQKVITTDYIVAHDILDGARDFTPRVGRFWRPRPKGWTGLKRKEQSRLETISRSESTGGANGGGISAVIRQIENLQAEGIVYNDLPNLFSAMRFMRDKIRISRGHEIIALKTVRDETVSLVRGYYQKQIDELVRKVAAEARSMTQEEAIKVTGLSLAATNAQRYETLGELERDVERATKYTAGVLEKIDQHSFRELDRY